MVSVLKVKGMSCQHCVMSVRKALGQLEGIKNVQVDLAKGRFDLIILKKLRPIELKKPSKMQGTKLFPLEGIRDWGLGVNQTLKPKPQCQEE